MTARAFLALNRILAALQGAQLFGHGALPVVVEFTTPEGTTLCMNVLTAKFDKNSGNVVLTV